MNEFNAEQNKGITQIHDDVSSCGRNMVAVYDDGTQYKIGEIEIDERGDAEHIHQKQFTQQSQVEFLEEDESVVHTRNRIGGIITGPRKNYMRTK